MTTAKKLLADYIDVTSQILDAWSEIGGCDEYQGIKKTNFGTHELSCSDLCPFKFMRDRTTQGCNKATLDELSARADIVEDDNNV